MKRAFLFFSLLIISAMTFAQLKPVKALDPVIGPTPKTGTISISSTPEGCYVKINGEAVGKTPLSIKKASGKYEIIFDLIGFETISKTVTVTAGKTTKCNVKLAEKKLSALDSLLLITDEVLDMKSNYTDDFTLNEEGKNIVSFQKDAAKYARNVKDIYTTSVSKEKGATLSDEELKAIITNNILRLQNNQSMEKSCLTEAITLVKDLQATESNVKMSLNFTYGTLLQLYAVSKEQPLNQENTNTIVSLIGQVKLAEAAGIIDDAFHEDKVVSRYLLFFRFLKDFYNAGNLRLVELKNEANSK